eukprot:jgi/Ulvmu1/10318/UM061_0001.1
MVKAHQVPTPVDDVREMLRWDHRYPLGYREPVEDIEEFAVAEQLAVAAAARAYSELVAAHQRAAAAHESAETAYVALEDAKRRIAAGRAEAAAHEAAAAELLLRRSAAKSKRKGRSYTKPETAAAEAQVLQGKAEALRKESAAEEAGLLDVYVEAELLKSVADSQRAAMAAAANTYNAALAGLSADTRRRAERAGLLPANAIAPQLTGGGCSVARTTPRPRYSRPRLQLGCTAQGGRLGRGPEPGGPLDIMMPI